MADATGKIEKLLTKIQTVPSLPAAVEKLCRMVNDPKAGVNEMSRVISADPALTARLLRVANSAFYGLTGKVGTISHAIMVLGAQQVRNLALGVTIFGGRFNPDQDPAIPREDFWRHSLATAIAVKSLAAAARIKRPEEIFIHGLLHDVGKQVFLEYMADDYVLLMQEKEETGRPLYEIEKERFGMDHGEVGGELCRYWRVPDALTEVVLAHHRAEGGGDVSETVRLARLVRTADDLAKIAALGLSGETGVARDLPARLERDGISAKACRKAVFTLRQEVENMASFFNLPPSSLPETAPPDAQGRPIAVLLADAFDAEAVHLSLSAMGYETVSSARSGLLRQAPVAAVGDGLISRDDREDLWKENVPLLDFTDWRKANSNGPGAPMPAYRLRRWLKETLTRVLT
jgi:HD-like signal output (HDOD) protein